MAKDEKFDRHFECLTVEIVRERLERLDEQIAETQDGLRLAHLREQRAWWSKQVEYAYRREGLLTPI